ncbi:hypothetical protein DM860_010879 [Cuscuta australis]|uniref:FK506-binding protein n=1 Tax=Cuscuta australis TaxID=267555 RepID=A0A328E0A6_9ASTE|nr:hypothetical protein DM860_010879 [Cuscuta australis]
MAFWGIKLKPGKPYALELEDDRGRLHVSQATLGAGSSEKKTTVQCVVGDKAPISLCSLFPGRLETCPLNIEFEEEEEVTLSVEGGHHVYLSGFFLGESKDYEEDGYSSEEDDYEDIGSDVSVYDSEEDDFDDCDLDLYPSSPVRNSGVKIEEIVEDKNLSVENDISNPPKKKKNGLSGGPKNSEQQIVVKDNNNAPIHESEDEDGFPISTSPKGTTEAVINEPKSLETDNKTAEKIQSVKRKIDSAGETSKFESAKQTKKNKKENVPVREETGLESMTPSNNADVNSKEQSPSAEMRNNGKTTNESEMEKKKNKKKKKKKQDTGVLSDGQQSGGKEIHSSVAEEEKPTPLRTYPNGLIIEELSMGKPDGKRAISGKKVKVHYIGKLQKNGKIFDSNVGKAPFQFRLGIGQVIKGWDVGVIGMRVGDKRRLTIPPAMGYGQKGAGPSIPPNSWLVFEVELVDVN